MIIDFNLIEKNILEGFKGGSGELVMQSHTDDNCKIMRHILRAGASIGAHTHDDSCEIIYMIKGNARVVYDGNIEQVNEGQVLLPERTHALPSKCERLRHRVSCHCPPVLTGYMPDISV